MSKQMGVLDPGEWLMTDLNAFEIAQMAPRGAAKISQFTGPSQPDGEWDHLPDITPFNPVLVMRSGAIGDLLMLSPALLALRAKSDGNQRVSLCCFPHHFPIFSGNRFISELIPYPLNASDAWKWRHIISLENTMESNHSQHATDVFAKALGLQTPLPSYKPTYHATDEEKATTKKHLFDNRPNIVVQPKASIANRDYPFPLWGQVIHKLEQRGWGVLLVGAKGQIPPLPPPLRTPFIRDLSQLDLSFRESAAVLAQAQAFCGVDSAFIHLCHALDIPAVGLYGPFPWQIRTLHAHKTIAISGTGECAGCCWHMHAGKMFPPNKPCSKIQHCVVMESIPPERIISKIDLLKP